jgi:integrase
MTMESIIRPTLTKQIALTLEDLEKLMRHEFKSKRLERSRDLLFFACVTGLRYGEMTSINRSNITDIIILKRKKDETKEAREITDKPFKIPSLKYDYVPPLIANQKQNKNKDCFEEMEHLQGRKKK